MCFGMAVGRRCIAGFHHEQAYAVLGCAMHSLGENTLVSELLDCLCAQMGRLLQSGVPTSRAALCGSCCLLASVVSAVLHCPLCAKLCWAMHGTYVPCISCCCHLALLPRAPPCSHHRAHLPGRAPTVCSAPACLRTGGASGCAIAQPSVTCLTHRQCWC
jgi:hypothetical protein